MRNTRKTPVCMGMPFIRNGRPEPGPDPSEGPQKALICQSQNPKNTFTFQPPTGPRKLTRVRHHRGSQGLHAVSAGWGPRSARYIGNPSPTVAVFGILSITYLMFSIGKKRAYCDFSGPKIRISGVQSNAALRISMGKEVTLPPDSLNFSNIAAIYRQYHCRSIDHAHHELC